MSKLSVVEILRRHDITGVCKEQLLYYFFFFREDSISFFYLVICCNIQFSCRITYEKTK